MSIFKENESYRPFTYPWAVEAEKVHRIDMNWNENQVDLADDLRQYNSEGGLATANVSHAQNKNLLNKMLMLFTEMDAQVGAGYAKLIAHVKNNEIRTMWLTFAAREVTHQRSYALAAETFGFSNADWSEFKKYKEMQDKLDIIAQDVGDLSVPLNFAKYLAVVFLAEGITLFGAFACLLNFKRFGLVMNFNSINEWSLRDEDDHVDRNISVFKEVRKYLTEEENQELDEFLVQLVSKYVEAEHSFLDIVFEMGDQEDLTKEQVKEFINYLGLLRLHQLDLVEAEQVGENPLEWIDYILTATTHTNFFENKVTDYSHNKLEGTVDYSKFLSKLEDRKLA
ncbi:MAG: putative ribonucleoside-diphosphate reductase subunit beta [Prokaryotic dsDNA virus sp.]|jgi:ribonucleotide reductase beta subunit family protein with ferritin-like domain|nr:MAG: putative ribonucleoside-diphosphate reductase subunit beta [Prokaryotic dsDNA virus sp.]|tara:strand:- start:86269 stop:87285 length:1017 start_codon:yes stop_codon:yes gene_type:complete